jgi:hypothetical protein
MLPSPAPGVEAGIANEGFRTFEWVKGVLVVRVPSLTFPCPLLADRFANRASLF